MNCSLTSSSVEEDMEEVFIRQVTEGMVEMEVCMEQVVVVVV